MKNVKNLESEREVKENRKKYIVTKTGVIIWKITQFLALYNVDILIEQKNEKRTKSHVALRKHECLDFLENFLYISQKNFCS